VDQANDTTPLPPGVHPVGSDVLRIVDGLKPAAPADQDQADEERPSCPEEPPAFTRLYLQAGRRYRPCLLKNFQPPNEDARKVLHTLESFCNVLPAEIEKGTNVVLFGPSGTGKDHLLTALARAAIVKTEGRRTVRFAYGHELFMELRERIGADLSEAALLKPYLAADVLILSDPQPPAGKLSDYQAAMLLTLVNRRYADRQATWVSLNVATGKEAEERLGVAVVERLRHGAVCCFCNWPSYRKPLDDYPKVS